MEVLEELRRAAGAYDYPAVTYDFGNGRERQHGSMSTVEEEIRSALRSPDPAAIRDGLSNILYWGFYRSPGRRDYRVDRFRQEVTAHQLGLAGHTFLRLTGPALRRLKDIQLPGFSQVSFLSKIRMFLEPDSYAVLDLKIAKLLADPRLPESLKVKVFSAIPVTAENERTYERWCMLCRRLARECAGTPWLRAVDVERALFYLIDKRKLDLAIVILRTGLAWDK
jgi:hypothetical protein